MTVNYFHGSVVSFCNCMQFHSNYMIILFSLNSCELKLFLILPDIVITFSDYKAKIGFTGQLLIEPKPKEPTKHQYDYGKCGTI